MINHILLTIKKREARRYFVTYLGGKMAGLGLVVAVQKNVFRVYVQPVGTAGSGAPVPIPTTGAEQMVSPAFMP